MLLIGLLIVCGIVYVIYTMNNGKTTQIKRANNIGMAGESEIGSILSSMGINGYVFNNLYYTFRNGKTTEIDLVFLTDRKIYIIESKNYSGIICGDESNPNWVTQYRNGQSYPLYNPIMQNKTHINAIKSILGASDQIIESVIVFGNKADISQVRQSGSCINTHQIQNYIRNSYNSSQIKLSKQEVDEAARRLTSLTGASNFKKQQHINQIKRNHR